MTAHGGVWRNRRGKKELTGTWWYLRNDRFRVLLDSRDRVTGENRELIVVGDRPEWGNWELTTDLAGEMKNEK